MTNPKRSTLDLLADRQLLSSKITDLLEGNVLDEDGEIDLDSDALKELNDLSLVLDDNADALVLKTEALQFAVMAQQAKLETYSEAVKAYQALKKRTQKTIDYLNDLTRANIEAVGEDNKLPTPSFPKLKLRQSGSKRCVINPEYKGKLEPEWFKPQTIKDISVSYLKDTYGDNPPQDEEYNPLYQLVKPEPSVSIK